MLIPDMVKKSVRLTECDGSIIVIREGDVMKAWRKS